MNFLNPLMLLGLAAAGIPLLLHLLNLRKLRTVEFSTLRFIKELQKTRIRKLKLRQLILLILRIMIVVFAVLAFSRPVMESTLPGFESYVKSSSVIIIDNSFSMDVSDEWGNRFNQAKNAARSIIKDLKEGSEAAIIPMASLNMGSKYSLTRNMNFLLGDLQKIKISNTSSDLASALKKASILLEDAVNPGREIYILTDAQYNILYRDRSKDSLSLLNSETPVFVLSIGSASEAQPKNLSVDSLNIISKIFQSGKIVELEAFVRNSSNNQAEGVVASLIFNERRVAQRSADIPPKEVRTSIIAAAPRSKGAFDAVVRIEGDDLEIDNSRYFGFVIPKSPRALVVGKPEYTDFIEIALTGDSLVRSNVISEFVTPQKFSSININNFDIVVLASGPLADNDLLRIENYVNTGGNAIIFAGDEYTADAFGNMLVNLGFGKPDNIRLNENSSAKFTSVDKMHPIFEGVFKGTTDNRAVVESPDIFRMMAANSGQPVISVSGGAFLAESGNGEGKTLYFAVPPTLDWSSFPLTGLFPTVIFRSIVYLTSGEDIAVSVEAGEPLTLKLPKKYAGGGNFRIVDPGGTEFFRQAAMLPGGAVLSFEPFRQLGNYTVYASQGQPVSIISVNPPESESILQSLDENELAGRIQALLGPPAKIELIEDSIDISNDIIKARTGTELWQFLLLSAILCAAAEMFVARTAKSESE